MLGCLKMTTKTDKLNNNSDLAPEPPPLGSATNNPKPRSSYSKDELAKWEQIRENLDKEVNYNSQLERSYAWKVRKRKRLSRVKGAYSIEYDYNNGQRLDIT